MWSQDKPGFIEEAAGVLLCPSLENSVTYGVSLAVRRARVNSEAPSFSSVCSTVSTLTSFFWFLCSVCLFDLLTHFKD